MIGRAMKNLIINAFTMSMKKAPTSGTIRKAY